MSTEIEQDCPCGATIRVRAEYSSQLDLVGDWREEHRGHGGQSEGLRGRCMSKYQLVGSFPVNCDLRAGHIGQHEATSQPLVEQTPTGRMAVMPASTTYWDDQFSVELVPPALTTVD